MRRMLLLLVSITIMGCAEEKTATGEILDFIPDNATIVVKMGHPDLFFDNLGGNEFLSSNNEHPLMQKLSEKFSYFNFFSQNQPALIAFSKNSKDEISYTYISDGIPEINNLDSIQNKKVETTSKGSFKIVEYELEGKTTFTTNINHFFIASDSRETIEQLLENKDRIPANRSDFEKAVKAASDKSPTIFINHEHFSEVFSQLFPAENGSFLNNFSNWTALDIEVTPTLLRMDGISTAGDTLPKFINLFRGVEPGINNLAAITPNTTNGFSSYAFESFAPLKSNLRSYDQKSQTINTSEEETLLENATEVGMIYSEEGNIFALKTLKNDISETFSAGAEMAEEFRGNRIYHYQANHNFQGILEPLPTLENPKYFLRLTDFLLFSEEIESLKSLVTHFQNKNTFGQNEAYISTAQKLSTEASVLWVSKNGNFKNVLAEAITEEYAAPTKDLKAGRFPFSAFQLIYNTNFAHVHVLLEKNEQEMNSSGVLQTASATLDAAFTSPPVFIENHVTNGMDIVVQDLENRLYLISGDGEIRWEKELKNPILGSIQEVDLFRNGRKQMAFATQKSIQVIDREGNAVKPFPMDFKDNITQPLAIFDYDNNHKYRFVVVQEKDVFMYDNKGNRVKGFGFTKAEEKISQPPKHIRMGNKDYIVIPEVSGKLNILDRRGNIRVPVKERMKFTKNEWYEHKNHFTTTNENGELVKISQAGAISRKPLDLAQNHFMEATPNNIVMLSDNQLTINDHTVELEYGVYTKPKIFSINNKIYVNVTDIQAHRVFLFNEKGQLLPEFPVYGNSMIDLANIDSDANLEFVVKGEENGVLVYELKE